MRLPFKSPPVAIWLFAAAFLIVAILWIGGATRLTESGLSITEWKPVSGVIPPGSDAAWRAEFANYKKIPQFAQINPHMKLAEFKVIYWWEWWHRLVARLLGVIYIVGFVAFVALKEMPKRLIWRGAGLIVLVAAQGAMGWFMVASGLTKRAFVAPERLAAHLCLALILLICTIWTALEALEGEARGRGAPMVWKVATGVLLGSVVLQCLLGALVAGNQAGLVYNDFPLMNGQVLPPIDWSKGVGIAFLHDQALVQFIHRVNAFILGGFALAYAFILPKQSHDDGLNRLAIAFSSMVVVQIVLGIATLVSVVPLPLALLHQVTAACLVMVVTWLMWSISRADRVFRMRHF